MLGTTQVVATVSILLVATAVLSLVAAVLAIKLRLATEPSSPWRTLTTALLALMVLMWAYVALLALGLMHSGFVALLYLASIATVTLYLRTVQRIEKFRAQ